MKDKHIVILFNPPIYLKFNLFAYSHHLSTFFYFLEFIFWFPVALIFILFSKIFLHKK